MSEPSDHSRREFLSLGAAAAGAALLADAATSIPASAAATAPPGTSAAMTPGAAWAVRGKILQVPEPDHLESLPDALVIIGPDGVIERVEGGQ